MKLFMLILILTNVCFTQTTTYEFLESQFYISIFNTNMTVDENWENMKNEFALRFKNKYLKDRYDSYHKIYSEKNILLNNFVEDELRKNGIYNNNKSYNFNYYTLLFRITFFPDYSQKSLDASNILLDNWDNSVRILDDSRIADISNSSEARKRNIELIEAKLLSDAAENEMLQPSVKILSSSVQENEQMECHKLQSLLIKKDYPASDFNEINYSNNFSNIFTAKYFISKGTKNQTFIEGQIGDGAGTLLGISLISNAVRYRYFSNNKDTSYFTLYAFGLGVVIPLIDSFEEEKLCINPSNSTIDLSGKDYSNVNLRIYVGNIEILNKYQNVDKIKWFNTNLEAGGDLNFKLSIFNIQAGVRYVYNSLYYYGGLGFNVAMPFKNGDALLKFD